MKNQSKIKEQNAKYILEELEPRQLFSGGIEGLVVSQVDSPAATYLELDTNKRQASTGADEVTTESAAEQQTREIVFVDTGVDNYQALVDDLTNNSDTSRDIEVVLLDNNSNGIDQISETLKGRTDLDAVHIISHGSDGSVQLGNIGLNADTLAENKLNISLWANAFSETGDILIYGCNLAVSEVGQSLIGELGKLTLTEVAASDDKTGHVSLGGDWELERVTGSIEASVAISAEAQQNYQAALVVYTWDGGGATNNWSEAANWTGDTVPDTADDVIFDGTNTSNVVFDVADTINNLTINPGYNGTITLAANLTVDGSFSMNSAAATLDMGGTTLTANGSWTLTAGTVDAGTGLVFFSGDATIDSGAMTFNSVFFDTGDRIIVGTMDIDGNLQTFMFSAGTTSFNGGQINVAGNFNSTLSLTPSTTAITLDGTGQQSLRDTGDLPGGLFTVNKASGSVLLASNIDLNATGQDLTLTSGNINMNGYDLSVNDVLTLGVGTEIHEMGGTLSYGSLVNSGTIFSAIAWDGGGATNNWSDAANWVGDVVPGSAVDVIFNATSTKGVIFDVADTINYMAIQNGYTGTITLANTLTIDGDFTMSSLAATLDLGANGVNANGDWIYTSGTVNSTGSTVAFTGDNTISSGSMSFGNVFFSSGDKTINGTMDIDGNFTNLFANSINGGLITIAGDFGSQTTMSASTTAITLDGVGDQQIFVTAGLVSGHFSIDKTSGNAVLTNPVTFVSPDQDFTLTSGLLNMNGFDLTIPDVLTLEAGTHITQAGGTLTYGTLVNNGGTGDVISSIPTPAATPTGVTWDGTNLWHADSGTGLIYELDTSGTVLSSFSAPGSSVRGLAWDGTNLWAIDDTSGTIYQLTTTGTVLSSFSAPGTGPRGLTWDGSNLWLSDTDTNTVYELTTTGTVLSSFSTPSTGPKGLAWDGTNLWLSDRVSNTVYELTTIGTVVSSFSVPSSTRGLTWDGTNFWAVDAGLNVIYRLQGVDNNAPILGDGTLSAINEDEVPAMIFGETVSTIFSGQFSDPDSGSSFSGIAVVGNSANPVTEGAWQYSSNAGSDWDDIGTVSDDANALSIATSTRIRFVPVADFNGTPTALVVRGLDDTYGGGWSTTAGSETRVNVDTTGNGGTTPIAGVTADILTSVTPQDDVSFSIVASPARFEAGPTQIDFTLSLAGSISAGNTVSVDIAPSGTATDGSDYETFLTAVNTAALATTGVSLAGSTLTFDDTFVGPNFAFSLNVIDDTLKEAPEQLITTLTNPTALSGSAILGTAVAVTNINDNDAVVFTISADNDPIAETGGSTTFTIDFGGVSLGPGTNAAVIVTPSGSALDGIDQDAIDDAITAALLPGVTYGAGSNAITFDGNLFTADNFQFTINALGDNLVEGDETFTLTLSGPVNATLGGATAASVTITDDDAVVFGATATVSITEESAGTATFTINLGGVLLGTGQTASIDLTQGGSASAFGVDYTVFPQLSAAIAATPGVGLAGQTLTFYDTFVGPTFSWTADVIDDNLVEGTENMSVILSNAVNATINAGQTVGSTDIPETDAVVFGITSTASISEETTGTTTFTVNLGGMLLANGNTASVDLTRTGASTDGVDHQDFLTQLGAAATATTGVTLVGNTLTFDDTFVGPTFAFNITAIDDAFVEGTESLAISLSNAVGASIDAGQFFAVTNIVETDVVVFGLTSTPTITEEGPGTATFTLNLGGVLLGTGQTASVDVTRGGTSTSSDTLDHETFLTQLGAAATATTGVTLLGNTLTFDDTFVGPDFAFNIAAIDDNLVEGTETLRVGIGNAVNAFVNPPQSLVITSITETDAVVFQVTATANTYVEANTITFRVDVGNVTLGAGQTASVDITPGGTTTDGVDHQAFMAQVAAAAAATPGVTLVGNTLTFDSAFVGPNFTFDILTFDDNLVEGTETLTATLSNALGGSLGALDTKSVNLNSNDNMVFNVTTFTSYAETDTVTFTIFTTSGLVTLEPGRTASVDITRSGTSIDGVDHQDFMTQLAAAVTATPGVTLVGNTLTFDSAWDGTNLEIHMDAVDDNVVENTETVTATLSNPVGGFLGTSPTRTANLTSLDVMRYQLISQNNVNEGNTHNFRLITGGVTMGAGLTSSVDITPSGTATDGVDHQDFMAQVAAAAAATPGVTLVGNTLTFDSTWVGPEFTFDILTFDDNVVENTETVRGDLSNVVNGILGPPSPWTGNILSNDAVVFGLTATPGASITEEAPGTINYTLNLGGVTLGTGFSASVDITPGGTTTDGVDHQDFLTQLGAAATATTGVTLVGNTLTFDDTFVGPTFAFNVQAIDDSLVEGTEALTATLSNAVNATINAGQTVASTNITETDAVVFQVSSFNNYVEANTVTFTVDVGNVTLGTGLTASVDIAPGGTTTDGVDHQDFMTQVAAAATATTGVTLVGNTLTFDDTFVGPVFTFDILTYDDNLVEGNETLTATLSNAVGGTLGAFDTWGINLISNDAVVFQVSSFNNYVEANTVTFTVDVGNVTLDTGLTASVDIAPGGTTTDGVDHQDFMTQVAAAATATTGVTLVGNTLTFDDTFVGPVFTFDILTYDDNLVEGNETLTATLSNAVGGTLGAFDTWGINLISADAVVFGINSTPSISEETLGTATFTIDLGGVLLGTGQTSSVDVTRTGMSSDTLDHETFLTQLGAAATATTGVTLVGNTLTFDDTFVGPTFAFNVQAIDDALLEGTEALTATLSNAVNASINAGQTIASTNITETDTIVYSITSTPSISEEALGTSTYTISLGGVTLGTGQTSSVDVISGGSSTDGVDHQVFLTQLGAAATATTGVTLVGNTLTFDSSFVGPNFSFTMQAIDDNLVEGTETMNVAVTNAVNAIINLAQSLASTDITETDAVVFGISANPGSVTEEAPGTFNYTINLGGALLGTGNNASVDITPSGSTTDGVDHQDFMIQVGNAAAATTGVTLVGNTLTFDDTFVGPTFGFSVQAIDDIRVEGTETLTATLSNAVGATINAGQITTNNNITEVDNISFGIGVNPGSITEEVPGTLNFTINLGGALPDIGQTASVDVTPTGTTTDGVDHQAFLTQMGAAAAATTGVTLIGNTLTFDDTFVGPLFSFTVQAINDEVFEGTETLGASLSNAVGGTINAAQASDISNIIEFDTIVLNISASNDPISEVGSTTFTIDFGGKTIGNGPTMSVIVNPSGSATEGVDYDAFDDAITAALSPGVTYNSGLNLLTFDGNNYAASNFQFTVNALTDVLTEGNESFTVTLIAAGNAILGGTPATTVTITDNAAPAFVGLDATPTFVEDGPAILLDNNATVSDAEHDALDDYTGATLNLVNTLGGNADDIYAIQSGGSLTVGVSDISAGGNVIAIYSYAPATGLQITFQDNGTTPTSALVDEVLQAIEYSNLSDTPPANVTVDYSMTDAQGLAGNGSITVGITPNNDAPVFSNLDANPTFVEDGPPIFLDTDATVSDPELSAADDYTGATLQIIRNAGGNADDSYTIQSGGSLTVGATDISVGGNVIAIYIDIPALGMQIAFQDNGTTPTEALVNEVMQAIQYSNSSNTPPANVQLDYILFDGSGLAGVDFITVDITPTNDPPVIINGPPAVVAEGATILGDLTNGVGDPDNAIDPASINIISGPTNGTLVVNPDGTASYTHNGSETISDVFTYTIDDVSGATSNVATVNFTITPVNDAPVITSDGGGATAALNIAENLNLVSSITSTDAEFDAVGYSLSGPDAGQFLLIGGNVLTYSGIFDFEAPTDANGDGIYEVTVQADDGNGGIDTQDLSITVIKPVSPVVEPPVVNTSGNTDPVEEEETTPLQTSLADTGGGQNSGPPEPEYYEVPGSVVVEPPANPEEEPVSNPEQESITNEEEQVGDQPEPENAAVPAPLIENNSEPNADQQTAAQQQALQDQLSNQAKLGSFLDADDSLVDEHERKLWKQMDAMNQQMNADLSQDQAEVVEAKIVMGSTVSLTAGFISWVLRGGALLTSMVSSVSVLTGFDVLPILKRSRKRENVTIDDPNIESTDDTDLDSTDYTESTVKVDELFIAEKNK